MATHYQRGRAFEWKIRKEYEAKGYYVTRSAGSKGYWDLVCLHPNIICLIQCKRVAKETSVKAEINKFNKKALGPTWCNRFLIVYATDTRNRFVVRHKPDPL